MCGRFTLGVEPVELQEEFDLSEVPAEWAIRENIAPTQPVAVLARADDRRIEYMRWGLIPSWAKDISIGSKLFNARAETIQEKPSFRTAFARRRCLIPADGFYEWQKQEKGLSKPFRFELKDKKPFAFAGLWELWRSSEGDELKSCTIITTTANDLVAKIHPRMPVMLDAETCWNWIEFRDLAELQEMLQPYPSEKMVSLSVERMPKDPAGFS
jgi:putative SOS response-associated peptidase YedK